MRLADAQEAFARLMLRASNREEALAGIDAEVDPSVRAAERTLLEALPGERLELYQALVRGALRSALAGTYPYTKQVLGDAWPDLCEAFLRARTPDHWDLNATTDALPGFLRETWLEERLERPRWLAELADYERIETLVFLAPDADPDRSPSLHAPVLNPTLQLESFQHDIAGWIRDHEARGGDEIEGEPEARQLITVFFRDQESARCRFLNVNPLTAFALQGWNDGATSLELADAFAPQLGLSPEQCLAQLEQLARSLALAGAVLITPEPVE